MSQSVDGVTTSYVLDTATPLTMVLAETNGTDTIYYLHGLDLVAQNDGTTTEYFAYDGLGSVRQMLDELGNLLFAQAFDPYGNPYESAGTNGTSFGFTGEQMDNRPIFLRAWKRVNPEKKKIPVYCPIYRAFACFARRNSFLCKISGASCCTLSSAM
jgi:hypothetical protein